MVLTNPQLRGYALLLTYLAAQIMMQRAIIGFKRGDDAKGRRLLAEALKFALYHAFLKRRHR